jgi:hypothetical protein
MSLIPVLKIVGGWLLAAVLFGLGLLYLLNPIAGLASLIIVMSGLMLIAAPAVHVGIALYQSKRKTYNAPLLTLYMFVGTLVTFFSLAFTGWFNFT